MVVVLTMTFVNQATCSNSFGTLFYTLHKKVSLSFLTGLKRLLIGLKKNQTAYSKAEHPGHPGRDRNSVGKKNMQRLYARQTGRKRVWTEEK